jgi:hypothetical protein
MHVVLIEPRFPTNQRLFVKALAEIGATVTAIGEGSKATLDDEMRHCLSHYEEVSNVCDEGAVLRALRFIHGRKTVDRVEATVEAHILSTARVREALEIPGTSYRTAFLCRDKPAMKDALRAGGVPCAQSGGASSVEEVLEFVDRVGYPSSSSPGMARAPRAPRAWRSEREPRGRDARAAGLGPGPRRGGRGVHRGPRGLLRHDHHRRQVVHDFATHYYPNVLEAMRTRWISPQIALTNRVDSAPGYAELKEMGQAVITALGIETSATHMEWFYGPKGPEVQRDRLPPAGRARLGPLRRGNDFDIYREWAMAIVHGRPGQRLSRRFSAGIIALRPECDGRISHYEGVDEVRRRFGAYLIDDFLPPPGTPTQPVEAGYMANAWMRFRHPDYDELRRLMDIVGQTVRVRANA